MNKKAWIRIVEAFIAILLVAGILTIVFVNQAYKPDKTEEIIQTQRIILDEIADDNELRAAVLSSDNATLIDNISKRIPSYLNFTIRNCEVSEVCGLPELAETYTKNDIYSDEVIISSNITDYGPRKLRLFVWEK